MLYACQTWHGSSPTPSALQPVPGVTASGARTTPEFAGTSGVALPSPRTPDHGATGGSVAAVGWLTNHPPPGEANSSKVVPKASATRPLGPVTVRSRWSGLSTAPRPNRSKYDSAAATEEGVAPNRAASAAVERKCWYSGVPGVYSAERRPETPDEEGGARPTSTDIGSVGGSGPRATIAGSGTNAGATSTEGVAEAAAFAASVGSPTGALDPTVPIEWAGAPEPAPTALASTTTMSTAHRTALRSDRTVTERRYRSDGRHIPLPRALRRKNS